MAVAQKAKPAAAKADGEKKERVQAPEPVFELLQVEGLPPEPTRGPRSERDAQIVANLNAIMEYPGAWFELGHFFTTAGAKSAYNRLIAVNDDGTPKVRGVPDGDFDVEHRKVKDDPREGVKSVLYGRFNAEEESDAE